MSFNILNKLLWLAPLAGLTDNSFRSICKQWGADIVVSEMVSADGLVYSYDKTAPYARFNDDQRPFGIQIFGSKPDIMAKAVQKISDFKPDFIDINMGCPVKKVIKRGAGSALMNNPLNACLIVEKVKSECEKQSMPLCVKIRSGWDHNSINAIEFARGVADAGADMIIIHPRTRSQMFAGKSDWSLIKRLKSQIDIPVIGNGDVISAEDANRMMSETNCDGVMIGRGAVGKPWIFQQIKYLWQKGILWHPQPEEIIETINQHYYLLLREKGEFVGIREMRKHLSAYTKGYPGSAQIRNLINQSEDISQIKQAVKKLIIYKHRDALIR